jgi:hypothetical protein
MIPTPPKKDLFLTRSYSLTPLTAELLMKLSIEATDSLALMTWGVATTDEKGEVER